MKQKRPVLLAGLIISLLLYTAELIYSFVTMLAAISALTMATGISAADSIFDVAGIIMIGAAVITIVFSLLGLIFSAVSIPRYKLSASDFQEKKGLIVTVVVFNFIVIALALFSLISELNVVSLILMIAFLVASILLIVDLSKNKKLLAAEYQTKQLQNLDVDVKAEEPKQMTNAEEPKQTTDSGDQN